MSKRKELLDFINNEKPVICYGAGRIGHEVLGYLQMLGIPVSYFVTTNKSEFETKMDVPIICIDEVDFSKQYNWLVTTLEDKQDLIVSQLKQRQVDRFYLIDKHLLNDIRKAITITSAKLKGKYSGERCFILATGPSILEQDLSRLKNEHVFSCSLSPLLEEYGNINPEFYVDASTYYDYFGRNLDNKNDGEFGINVFRLYEKMISSKTIFLDYMDLPFVQKTDLLLNKNVFFLFQEGEWNPRSRIYDITNKTPGIQTVTIMMIKIAMYMGFKNIYLLGTEHNLETQKNYKHSYSFEKIRDYGFDDLYNEFTSINNKTSVWSRREKLKAMYNIYEQYHYLNIIAHKNGINIFNATKGGSLDEFKRVNYEELF